MRRMKEIREPRMVPTRAPVEREWAWEWEWEAGETVGADGSGEVEVVTDEVLVGKEVEEVDEEVEVVEDAMLLAVEPFVMRFM